MASSLPLTRHAAWGTRSKVGQACMGTCSWGIVCNLSRLSLQICPELLSLGLWPSGELEWIIANKLHGVQLSLTNERCFQEMGDTQEQSPGSMAFASSLSMQWLSPVHTNHCYQDYSPASPKATVETSSAVSTKVPRLLAQGAAPNLLVSLNLATHLKRAPFFTHHWSHLFLEDPGSQQGEMCSVKPSTG